MSGCKKSGIHVFRSTGGVVSGNVVTGNNTSGAAGEANIYYNASRVVESGNVS
ncbi:MAG: hypothetical protein HY703_05000 [Gemmatimonadetes bacterium]|nr:hypothetical protein [Gemmatimonadota bacterium]